MCRFGGDGPGRSDDSNDADAFRRNLEAAAARVLERLQARGEEVEDMVDAVSEVLAPGRFLLTCPCYV